MTEPTVRELLRRRKITPGPREMTGEERLAWESVARSGDHPNLDGGSPYYDGYGEEMTYGEYFDENDES